MANRVFHRNKSFQYISSQLVSTLKQVAVYRFDESSRRVKVRETNSSLVGDLLLCGARKTANMQIFLDSDETIHKVLDYDRCIDSTDLELAKEIINHSY